jgi:dTDP-glucose 4,6-dehydratase
VIAQIATGRDEVRLGAIAPTRDFSFVEDTVQGFMALAACDDAVGQVVNLGSGFEISVGETARLIADVMGRRITILTDEERLRPENSEVNRLWSDNGKARRLTPWRPAYQGLAGFRRGLETTVEWFRHPANVASYKGDIYNV